jgi:hypothetical protein
VERADLDILQVTDDPDRVCEIVVAGHAAQLNHSLNSPHT